VNLDSTGRNFRSSEILPIKADFKQVVIVVTAATWGLSLAFQIDGNNKIFSVCQCNRMKVSQLSLNSRKKTGENKFVPFKDKPRRLVPVCR
jgi:hypothetical protein